MAKNKDFFIGLIVDIRIPRKDSFINYSVKKIINQLWFGEDNMSLLELFGIVFLAMVIINAVVGVWAVKTAGNEEEFTVSYSSSK